MGSTRYITSMGELSRKDNSLCYRKNGKNIYIPVENTKEIYCMNEISMNTNFWIFYHKIILLFIFLTIMRDIVGHSTQRISI